MPFHQILSASQWIAAMTFSVISGRLTKIAASTRSLKARRSPLREATSTAPRRSSAATTTEPRSPGGAMAEIDAEGIENVAQDARHAQQRDATAAAIDALPGQQPVHVIAQRRGFAVAVVGIVEAEQNKAVAR